MARRLATWTLLAAGAFGLWKAGSFIFNRRPDVDRLVNQLWVERLPRDGRDMVWHFIAIDRRGRHDGALGRSSRWRVESDRFVWRRQGNELRFRTPQNGCESQLLARTWRCAGEAPEGFDLCLELSGHGHVYRYYSREAWVIKDGAVVEDVAWLMPATSQVANDEAPIDEARLGGGPTAAECGPRPVLD